MKESKTRTFFFWPVTIPLYIIHTNLWDPGTSLSNNSEGSHLMDSMCDLTQFFVSNITMETHAEHLTKRFMENVVLSFGMVTILFFDADSWFKKVLKDMCSSLGIIYWPLAHGNHKDTSIEKYHLFFNKHRQYQAKI